MPDPNPSPIFYPNPTLMFTPTLPRCILAGTDYLPSVYGVGLKTAHTALRRQRVYHTGLEP